MKVQQSINLLIKTGAWKATRYISDKLVERVTRRRYLRDKKNPFDRTLEFVVNVGRPNYLERRFIRACKKSGEPFPVKKVQFRYLPKKHK